VTFHFGPEGEEGKGLPMEKLTGGCQEKGRLKAFEEKQGEGSSSPIAVHHLDQLFRSNVQ
jgi:hypothetical protein